MRDSYTKAVIPSRKSDSLGETFRTVLYAVAIAFLVRTLAFEPFNIPSGSMIPTLLVGDYLFVSKYSYGYSKYTISLGLPLFEGRLFGRLPERGDVAVFKLPTDNKTDYIKRIIGLPGDRVQVIGGVLHLNGQSVIRQRIEDFEGVGRNGQPVWVAQFLETLPGGPTHRILEYSDDRPYDNTREFIVPEEHVFAMGDNRDNSEDSRASVGFVPMENLVGRAEFLFFSLAEGTRFWEVWKWPWDVRYSRFFNSVH